MTDHHFNVEVAKECGVNASILFTNIYFWVEHNRANGANFHDGTYWTFNSMKAFSELFPYLSQKQINTALKKLEDEELIATGNYNKLPFDRTKWYSVTKKGYSFMQKGEIPIDQKGDMDLPEKSNEILPPGQLTFSPEGGPIPDINTDKKTNILNLKKERKKGKQEQTNYDQIINRLVASEEVKTELYEFIKMRKFIKKPLTNKGLELTINQLFNLSVVPGDQIKILDNSIVNNWAGLFPLKTTNQQQERQNEVKRDGSEYSEFDL